MYAKKSVSMKVVVLLLAVVLLIGCTVGGTLAWLIANTDPVVNTFTTSDVSITLTETDTTLVDGKYTKEFKMVPGADITKDPKVTVEAGSESCWLFVKIKETENTANQVTNGTADATTFITYAVAAGWTALPDNDGVYFMKHDATSNGTPFSVLEDDKVSVPDTVTKEMMDAIDDETIKLTFTAYAIQQEGFTSGADDATNAADAWAEISNP